MPLDHLFGSAVGGCVPGAEVEVLPTAFNAVQAWNGHKKLGPAVAYDAMDACMEMADQHGSGMVMVDEAFHYLWGGGEPGGTRGGRGNMAEQLNQNLQKLGIGQKTIDTISSDMRLEISTIRSQFQNPEADRDARRQQRTSIRDRVLSVHLNSDQQRELAILLAAAGRRANIWIKGEDGQPEAKLIRIGINDDRFTEIVTGLKEGDEVVTRVRTTSGD